MRTIITILFFFMVTNKLHSQNQERKAVLTDKSIVKDSSGSVYSADIWRKLLLTGYYIIKAENPGNAGSDFILIRLSEEEKQKRLSNAPKPKESTSFVTGKEVKSFSTTDINGKKYKLKDLRSKVVVLNFWFINCRPCRTEILELNKLVKEYKDSSDIVFLAIALDSRNDLRDFLRTNPFNYIIIDDGRAIAQQYDVTAYPTHAVIDQQGRAYFHTAGTGSSTIYWLGKSIKELMGLKNQEK